MADIDSEFQQAVTAVSALAADPGNDTKLQLYALYKQATAGDVDGKRPGFTNPVGRAKYDAWAGLAGTDADEAKRQYVELVAGLAG
ncbi:MAG TPA: acyl-CoA-binding protein [Jiangellales bacterium]|nr:acyl-CoA-binding protein [Jiangellales bacterium]